jgi:hypothetical protein
MSHMNPTIGSRASGLAPITTPPLFLPRSGHAEPAYTSLEPSRGSVVPAITVRALAQLMAVRRFVTFLALFSIQTAYRFEPETTGLLTPEVVIRSATTPKCSKNWTG